MLQRERIMAVCGIYARTSIETDGTSIEQQIELGIKFCKANDFEYQVYQDAGKSGYKIYDDEDPFKHRPAFTKLLSDIEDKIIDKIWVFEYSRLTRRPEIQYAIDKTFKKHDVTVYEQEKKLENDAQSKMIKGIISHVYEFERQMIEARTARGKRKTINSGLRSYWKTYGYRQAGKNERYIVWEPVQSEIENIRFAYDNFLNGRPINSIVKKLHQDEPEPRLKVLYKVYRNILTRFDYTGFSLTTEGAKLCNKYKKLEIDSLSFLGEQEDGKPKYYVPSINYPAQITSIESWAASMGKLRENKEIFRNYKRAANSDIFTGIIKCPYCGLYYYSQNDRRNKYLYYTHVMTKKCLQRPKSSRREKINSLAGVFYFYYYLVYEDTNEFLKENQTVANLNIAKVKDRLATVQSDNRKLEKQIANLQSVYEDSTDKDLIKLTLTKEAELKIRLDANNENVLRLKSELSQLHAEFKKNLKLLTYESVKKTVISYFEKLGAEEKRKALLKIIKECVLFKSYLLINTGKMLFIFDIKEDYAITEELYNQFKSAEMYKPHFTTHGNFENPKPHGDIEIVSTSHFLVQESGKVIRQYKMKNPEDLKITEEKLEILEIDYDLKDIESVICFTDL